MKKQKRYKSIIKKAASIVLGIALVIVPFAGLDNLKQVSAAEEKPEKNIAFLSTDGFNSPVEGMNYVYYGKYDKTNPTKYRVLNKNTSEFSKTGESSLFLDCDEKLIDDENIIYDSPMDAFTNVWVNTMVRRHLNEDIFYNCEGVFTSFEKDAIIKSYKDHPSEQDYNFVNFQPLTGEKIFLLDIAEVYNPNYKYSSGEISERYTKGMTWWTRSRYEKGETAVGVNTEGTLEEHHIYDDLLVSPAFNISLSSILYTSLVGGEVGKKGAEFKLTLKDESMIIEPKGELNNNEGILDIAYQISGEHANKANGVYVLITDKEYSEEGAQIKSFGKLSLKSDTFSLEGEGTYKLPEDYQESWHTYLLADNTNGFKETDLSSCPTEITVPMNSQEVDAPVPVENLVYNGEEKTLVSEAVVKKGNNTEGSITYSLDKENWSTDLPKGTDAGTYDVYYKVAKNSGYYEYLSKNPVQVVISPIEPEIPSGLTAIYGQTLAEVELPDGWSWQDSAQEVGNAGENIFKADYNGKNPNYSDKKNVDLTVAVDKKAVEISYLEDKVNKAYGDEDFINELSNPGDGAITYESDTPEVATVDSESGEVKIVGIGSAIITANVTDSDNYTYTTKSAEYAVYVDKGEPEIIKAPAAKDLTYNGNYQLLIDAGEVVGGMPYYAVKQGDELPDDSDFTKFIPMAQEAGTYKIYYKILANDLYKELVVEEPIEVEIKEKPVDPTPDPKPDPKPDPTPDDGSKKDSEDGSTPSVGDTFVVSGTKYKILSANTVSLIQAKNAKTVTVPATVKNSGKTYKVTGIGAKAFKKSKATKVIIKTKNLKKASVKKSLTGSKVKKIQIKVGKKKVNKTYVKKYKKIFTKKNAGKKVKVTL